MSVVWVCVEASAILGILLRHERLASDVDLVLLAEDTDGFSGSDLKREAMTRMI